jgi:hypothetical protein
MNRRMKNWDYDVLHGLTLSVDCWFVFCFRLELWRDQHIEYLTKGLRHLGPNFHVLDAK